MQNLFLMLPTIGYSMLFKATIAYRQSSSLPPKSNSTTLKYPITDESRCQTTNVNSTKKQFFVNARLTTNKKWQLPNYRCKHKKKTTS